jgi:small-conductance mechanosensitive channel
LAEIDDTLISRIKSVMDIILFLSFIYVIGKVIVGVANFYVRRGKLPHTTIFVNIARLITFVLAFALVLNLMGIGIEPIIATLGIGAIAIALALQDSLSNLFAGIYIIAVRQINPDDYVKLQSGEEGYIVDINWRNTTIRSIQNNLIIIPNNVLAGTIVTNFSLPIKEMTIRIPIGVSYDADLDKVEKVCITTAKEVLQDFKYVEEFEPRVRFHTFGDFSVNFNLIVKILEFQQQYEVQHEIVKAIHRNFVQKGIKIPFPIRRIYQKED